MLDKKSYHVFFNISSGKNYRAHQIIIEFQTVTADNGIIDVFLNQVPVLQSFLTLYG